MRLLIAAVSRLLHRTEPAPVPGPGLTRADLDALEPDVEARHGQLLDDVLAAGNERLVRAGGECR